MNAKWYRRVMIGEFPVIPAAMVGVGLILLIIGISIVDSHTQMSNICNSFGGQVGQALDQNAAQTCNNNANAMGTASALVVVGGVLLVVGGLKLRASYAITRALRVARGAKGY